MELPQSPLLLQPEDQEGHEERLVYLVTRDRDFANFIAQQIIHFGYHLYHIREIKSIPKVFADHQSVAVLVDLPSWELDEDQEMLSEIRTIKKKSIPLIFISEVDDQEVRLKAIHEGGMAFFTKPVNMVSLIDRLDSLTTPGSEPQPSRVLIIEDQAAVASYYQMILRMSGMDAQVVTNSFDVLEQVREYHPDLILMDTVMPDIKGIDLARVIRQIDDYVSIPIIFLSSEDDFDKRMEALDLGGDDFLVKPIKGSHLMSVVRSRLERLKTLRSYMVRDSLTNLLNHTTFRNMLAQEVNRCIRQQGRLALAMMDLDNFKLVNDTYGHAAGDSVLKSLSRLLKQRLRKTDIVGRYGGEEFVALLLDCEAAQAQETMHEIRQHFSEIEFYPNEENALTVTFSCGIATFPEFGNAQVLSDAADKALYVAKTAGKNQIRIALP